MADAVALRSDPSGGLHGPATARLIALLLPAALLIGAFGSQYLGHLYPCHLCWWQRYAHMVAFALAVIAFSAPAATPRARTFTLLAALAIATSGAIGVYHAGVEARIFEGFSTCDTLPKASSTAELLKQITHAPLVRCDEVQFSFLGISMAGWNAILSLGGAALILLFSLRTKRA
jgi:disulfide bond formation protein DsbB